ncbi:MAG TPA: PepSY-associated TM helix domain-containing protein [Porticoccaceae bacterium]
MTLGSVRQWHWISSALCLVGMLLFAVTGITLNHAAAISTTPRIQTVELTVPADLLVSLEIPDDGVGPLPDKLRRWLDDKHGLVVGDDAKGEWDDAEVYVSLPRPGGDAWLSLDLESGELLYERTDRGWVSYLNDLHKGRNTGLAWSWFIDLFAVACVVFCVTGLVLLYRQTVSRPSTWPMVGLGLVIPLLLVVLFVHS